MTLSTGANVIKHFTAVSYSIHNKLERWSQANLSKPSLMFVGKAGAYLSEVPYRCSTLR
jgi:hypothetical protein